MVALDVTNISAGCVRECGVRRNIDIIWVTWNHSRNILKRKTAFLGKILWPDLTTIESSWRYSS